MQYSLNYSGTRLLSTENYNYSISCRKFRLRACLHGGGGPQVGEVTRLGEVKK